MRNMGYNLSHKPTLRIFGISSSIYVYRRRRCEQWSCLGVMKVANPRHGLIVITASGVDGDMEQRHHITITSVYEHKYF
jgi:hypothetical protein